MNIRAFILFQFLASSLPLSADIIIQQSNITGEADYGTGQGQSFLLPAGETVAAIQLHIGSAGNDGGSIFVRLWEATGSPGSSFGRASAQPVATGTLDRSNVSGTPDWFTIVLDQSYTNQGPTAAYLVFEIELLTSGSDGWNNYSYSNQEPYSGGHSAYWTGSQYTIRDGQDLAFRILDSARDASIQEILLVVDFITDNIYEVDPETGAQSVVSDDPRLQGPTEIVVSPSGRIFIANLYSDEILEYDDSDQTVSVFASAGYLNAPLASISTAMETSLSPTAMAILLLPSTSTRISKYYSHRQPSYRPM
ncbi:MAG: hypothetical protein HC888_09050 [Candidatus Competibacteraceae bacterium]|nr:hypothetical protein [Candidatus Competibacteraceae bacterium]